MIDDEQERVHYDLSEWSIVAQAALVERLADADIEHSWQGTELLVSADDEARVDELIGEVESMTFLDVARVTDETEYDLVSWTDHDRMRLSARLSDALIPYRWEQSVLVVPSEHEEATDRFIDADLLESD